MEEERRATAMLRDPFEEWLSTQEYKRSHLIFLVEWLAIFAAGWLFWSVLFILAPGSVAPGLAATFVSGLYATCLLYGRLLRVTGCRRCASPMPFMRREIGRRHLRGREQCKELEYGGEEWGRHYVRTYCKVVRTDFVTYRCHKCDQVWEEKVEVPISGYRPVERRDL
jgi:hypothetical protein